MGQYVQESYSSVVGAYIIQKKAIRICGNVDYRAMLMQIDVIDKGQLPPSSTSTTEYRKVFRNWWGQTKNQRERLIGFFYVNWSRYRG